MQLNREFCNAFYTDMSKQTGSRKDITIIIITIRTDAASTYLSLLSKDMIVNVKTRVLKRHTSDHIFFMVCSSLFTSSSFSSSSFFPFPSPPPLCFNFIHASEFIITSLHDFFMFSSSSSSPIQVSSLAIVVVKESIISFCKTNNKMSHESENDPVL